MKTSLLTNSVNFSALAKKLRCKNTELIETKGDFLREDEFD